MKKVYVKIEGIHCNHCEAKIINELLKNKKINDVKISKNIATISYVGNLDHKEVIDAITKIDYITKEEYISEDLKTIDSNIKLKEFIIILVCIVGAFITIRILFGFNILNYIPTIDSSITYSMLIVTGMLTSIHCIGMCGAINLMAVVNNSNKRSLKKPILYNLGRIISYTIIGGIVGFIGSILSINETITAFMILLASLVMFGMSLNMLGMIKFKLPKITKCNIKRKANNSFIIGILNGLMPCGPLQAMQIYALSTGSFIHGALSMFLFGIGTVPFMLLFGIIFNLINGKIKVLFNKIASILILILSLVMLNRGLLSLNIDIFKKFDDDFTASVLYENYQVIEFDLSYDHYENIILQKDIPVKMIIHISEKYLTGCNNEIIMRDFGIKQSLEVGNNVIEFVPTQIGIYTYTCWMNMIKANIKVIDNQKYFKEEKNE